MLERRQHNDFLVKKLGQSDILYSMHGRKTDDGPMKIKLLIEDVWLRLYVKCQDVQQMDQRVSLKLT